MNFQQQKRICCFYLSNYKLNVLVKCDSFLCLVFLINLSFLSFFHTANIKKPDALQSVNTLCLCSRVRTHNILTFHIKIPLRSRQNPKDPIHVRFHIASQEGLILLDLYLARGSTSRRAPLFLSLSLSLSFIFLSFFFCSKVFDLLGCSSGAEHYWWEVSLLPAPAFPSHTLTLHHIDPHSPLRQRPK